MCDNSYKLGINLDTRDVVTLLEVGRMCAAIADARKYDGPVLSGVEALAAVSPFEAPGVITAHDAFNQVEEPGAVDPGAAFAHAATAPNPTEGAALNSTTAGPAGGVQEQPPAPPASGGAAAGPGAERDTTGLPWDARINTDNRAKTKPGVWKRKAGLTDEFYNGVIAELKGVMNGAPAQPPTPPTGQIVTDAGGQPVNGPAGIPGHPGTTTPPQPPIPPVTDNPAINATVAAATTDEPIPQNFPDFLGAISKRTTGNPPKLTQPEITTALQVVGAMNGCTLNSLSDFNARADLIPAAYAELKKVWDAKP